MSCFCLFGKKTVPAEPAQVVAVPEPTPQPPAGNNHSAVKDSQDAAGLSTARTEQQSTRGGGSCPAGHREHATSKRTAQDSISPSDVDAQMHASVPDWVQKGPMQGAPGDGGHTIEIVGDIGSMNHGTGGFQTRATPRSVFRPADPHSSRSNTQDPVPAAGRPPRPSTAAPTTADANGENVYDWMQVESASHAVAGNGTADHTASNQVLVRDGDNTCTPGSDILVSDKWLHVPYFKQFKGLRGKLTRRGMNGATWYAAFPGCPEQAFSTGMHGQYILCYAPPLPPPPAAQAGVGYATADENATGINAAANNQDSVSDSSFALATGVYTYNTRTHTHTHKNTYTIATTATTTTPKYKR